MVLKKLPVALVLFCVLVHLGCNGDTSPTSMKPVVTETTVVTDHHLNNSNAGQILSLAVGDTFDVTLQTIGPGSYGTPTISNGVIQFLGESLAPLPIPAGPTQIYLFRSLLVGNADISISHSGNNSTFTLSCKVQ